MKLVILDRDGVINQDSPDYIKCPDEWIPIAGSLEAIARLNQAKILVAVASNQSGVGRGLYSMDTLNQIHGKMNAKLRACGGHIDVVAFCPHRPDAGCECRKPKPGMLRSISDQLHIPLTEAYFVGDSYKDIEAARAVAATPVLVRTGKGEQTYADHQEDLVGIDMYSDLAQVVDALLSN